MNVSMASSPFLPVSQLWLLAVTSASKPASAIAARVMMFTGDIMCALGQQRAVEKYGFDFHNSFSQIKSTLAEADFAAGVLETTCSFP